MKIWRCTDKKYRYRIGNSFRKYSWQHRWVLGSCIYTSHFGVRRRPVTERLLLMLMMLMMMMRGRRRRRRGGWSWERCHSTSIRPSVTTWCDEFGRQRRSSARRKGNRKMSSNLSHGLTDKMLPVIDADTRIRKWKMAMKCGTDNDRCSALICTTHYPLLLLLLLFPIIYAFVIYRIEFRGQTDPRHTQKFSWWFTV